MDLNELKKIPVILDGDPGHDDAIAWMLTKEDFEIFRAEETIRLSIDSMEMPNLSAAFGI